MLESKLPGIVALRARDFVAGLPFNKTTFYESFRELPPALQPREIRIGTLRLFTETPADWLKRIEAAQARNEARER